VRCGQRAFEDTGLRVWYVVCACVRACVWYVCVRGVCVRVVCVCACVCGVCVRGVCACVWIAGKD